MATTPNPRSPEGNHDPAGSTQMFRAFVNEGARSPRPRGAARSGRPRVGLIVGVVVVIVAVAAVAWLALS